MADTKDYEALGEACYEGQLETIAELLKAGLSPDGHETQRDYQRPLSLALMNKQFEAAQKLLDAGASPRWGSAFLDDFLEDAKHEPFIDIILNDARRLSGRR